MGACHRISSWNEHICRELLILHNHCLEHNGLSDILIWIILCINIPNTVILILKMNHILIAVIRKYIFWLQSLSILCLKHHLCTAVYCLD